MNGKSLFIVSGIASAIALLVACANSSSDHASHRTATQQSSSIGAANVRQDKIQRPDISSIHDFGDRHFEKIIQKVRILQTGQTQNNTVLRIVQLGDSHTASDTITSWVRQRLQQQWGNAGIGWIPPMAIPGQRHELVAYKSSGWKLTNSRKTTDADFPLGGYIATPIRNNAKITVSPRYQTSDTWIAHFLIRQGKTPLSLIDATGKKVTLSSPVRHNWQVKTVEVKMPFDIKSASAYGTQLGGYWLEKKKSAGVIVSPIGTNGAQATIWQRWGNQWLDHLKASQADLVILSYGTNEALNRDLKTKDMESALRDEIRMIRKALPDSSIMIVSAPDSILKKNRGETACAMKQPPMLQEVKQIQLKVAKQENTLFWDWQHAMGGDCSIEQWNALDMAKDDMIHLTSSGYKKSADFFYDDFIHLMKSQGGK